jgi:hypothetical protein
VLDYISSAPLLLAPVSTAPSLHARGPLPCTRIRLRKRAESATGRTFRSHPRTRQSNSARTSAFALPLLLLARLAKSVAASLSVASAAPRRALDVVEPWKETLDAMLFAGKLLPNPPLLLLCSLACASAIRTSAPRYSSSCCWTHARFGLATSQVPPRPSLPNYRRARPRCPPCGLVPSRHTSPPSAHARTARVLGRVTSCLHHSRAAAAAPLARARQYREPRACSSAATPILFYSRAATPRASFPCRLAPVPLTRLCHASRASRVHTRAYGRPLLASARSPAPAQAEPPHTALAHALQPSASAPLLGPPEPPLCASARLAPAEPPPRAQQLPPAPAPVRCAPACACARPAARAASHPSPRRAAAARLEPPAPACPAPARPRASAAQLLPSPGAHPSRASARLWRGERGRGRTRVETRERERRRQRINKHQGEEKQRRRGNGFPQGLMRNFRKLQGPVCKAKFPIYNIALGLKFKNSKLTSLNMKF